MDERQRLRELLDEAAELREARDWKAAGKALEAAARLIDRDKRLMPRLHYERAHWEAGQGHLTEAREKAERAVSALRGQSVALDGVPKMPSARMLLAGICLMAGDREAARTQLARILADPEADASVREEALRGQEALRQGEGEKLFRAGDYAGAAAVFEGVLAVYRVEDEYRGELLLWLAQTYDRMDRFSDAQECYEQVSEMPGASARAKGIARSGALFMEGQRLFAARQFKQGREAFRAMLKVLEEDDPFRAQALLMAGECSFRLLDFEDVKACGEAVLAFPGATEKNREDARGLIAEIPGREKQVVLKFARFLRGGK